MLSGLAFAGSTDASKPERARAVVSASLSPAGEVRIGADDDFEPESLHRVWSLTNSGTDTLQWQARSSQPWITFAGRASGALAPGESVEVAADVDTFAAGASGSARVTFEDSTTATELTETTVTVSPSFFVGAGNTGGWTKFSPSPDTRTIYVSSASGSDSNDGLSPASAKRTIAAGVALLRHGYPDWLLLERGGLWHESFGQWKKSGRSAGRPMLISTYGSALARPRLDTGALPALWTSGGNGSPATIDNLAIVGLSLRADAYAGAGDCAGIRLLQPGSHVLVEDCLISGYSQNLVFQGYGGRHRDFRLRRSVIVDAYAIHAIGGHAQGLYAYAVDGLLIEECLFDHNGWNESVPGAGADIFSHNLYIDNDNTGVVVRANIIANASSHGMQLRPGGTVVNNLFVRNSIALSVGGGNNPDPGGVTALVRGNVILDGKNIDAANPRGWGMWFANIASGRVAHNVIANNVLGTGASAFTVVGNHMGDTQPSIGVHNLQIKSNTLFNWAGGFRFTGDASQLTNIELTRNSVQDWSTDECLLSHSVANTVGAIDSTSNCFFSEHAPMSAWTDIGSALHTMSYWFGVVNDAHSWVQHLNYPSPDRSVGSYNATLGGPPAYDAFLNEARLQSSRNWRPEYTGVVANRYIRKGF